MSTIYCSKVKLRFIMKEFLLGLYLSIPFILIFLFCVNVKISELDKALCVMLIEICCQFYCHINNINSYEQRKENNRRSL